MRPNWSVGAGGRNLFTRTIRRTMRHSRQLYAALILAMGLSALLLLTAVAGLAPNQSIAAAAPDLSPTATPPTNSTLSLVSPSSGQGPVGATVTLQGSGWPSGQVGVGLAPSAEACTTPSTGWTNYFQTFSVGADGAFTYSFTWPAGVDASSPYYLCAAAGGQSASSGGIAAQQTYTVRSSQPPTLSLSSSNVEVGQPFTITGSSFYGEPTVNISINNVFNQAAHPDGNGSFIVTVTPTASQAGNASILAQSPAENGGKPVLTAAAQISVLGAPTVTPAPSPTPTVAPTSTSASSGGTLGGGNSGGSGGDNTGLIIGLIVAIVLVLLLIGGAITFLVLRRRGGGQEFPGGPAGPGGPGGGWGGYPGSGGTGPVPQYGQGNSGHFGAAGAGGYGGSGFYPEQGAYPGSGVQIGGVAQWDDAPTAGGMGGIGGGASWGAPEESAPGPDWQPRPMSGSRSRYDDPSYPPYPAQEEAPVDPYGATGPGAYPPPDPWSSGTSGFSGPTQGYPQPGRGTGYPPPNPPRRQPPENNWNGEDWNQGGDTRGSGGTNPTNQGW